jgi:hypothetical protein
MVAPLSCSIHAAVIRIHDESLGKPCNRHDSTKSFELFDLRFSCARSTRATTRNDAQRRATTRNDAQRRATTRNDAQRR